MKNSPNFECLNLPSNFELNYSLYEFSIVCFEKIPVVVDVW